MASFSAKDYSSKSFGPGSRTVVPLSQPTTEPFLSLGPPKK